MLYDGMSSGHKKNAQSWPEIGQDEETLREYRLTHEKIIHAAELTQEAAGTFKPRAIEGLGEHFKRAVENPAGDEFAPDDFIYFNVPVCDLDAIEGGAEMKGCATTEYLPISSFKNCFIEFLSHNCARLRYSGEPDGEEWPYQWELPVSQLG